MQLQIIIMINQQTIQRILDTAQIEEVIGEFVSLKKRGANHIGCCPFHNEKTPSFHVSASKGIFKCFGCGEAGDVVKFLMKHEHFSYPEALHWLANKYNIPIEEEKLTDEQKEQRNERDALFHISAFAQKYFENLMFNDEMGKAIGLSYFHSRGMTDDIIKKFGLGYCLDEWTNFSEYAKRNGYSEKALVDTGLSVMRDDGSLYDRFRGRVMFPIFSISGRVLGFSGRILTNDKHLPKYVNSPDSVIYNKGNVLYGIFQAKNAIGKFDKCYLVEGNVDVVSMHQSGVENTVASCGTALTAGQVRLIKRYTPNVTILYDGDAAGVKAALKAIDLLFEEGMHVRVVLFPDGDDPDSYARKYGSEKLQQYLQDHEENFVAFKIRVLLAGVDNDPIKRSEVVKDIISTIALVPDHLERSEYVKQCAFSLKMHEETITRELAKIIERNRQKKWREESKAGQQSVTPPEENTLAGTTTPISVDVTPDVQVQYDEQSVITRSTKAPHQDMSNINPAEMQERKLACLMITHGNTIFPGTDVNAIADEDLYKYRIANMILDGLQEWKCEFSNPLYKRIQSLYESCIADNKPFPDYRFFLSYDDPEVKEFALSILMESEYKISDTWAKKNVYTPSIESKLAQDIAESILAYKMKVLEIRMSENSLKILYAQSPEEEMLYVAERREMDELRKELGKCMNRVVS